MPQIERNPHKRVVDQPVPGFFKMRLVKGGPYVAAKIEHIDGKWSATINGEEQSPRHEDPILAGGVLRIWHAGQEIPEHEYEYKVLFAAYAVEHEPNHPAANPLKPINLAALPPVFKLPE